jgi:hypothetical protein
MALSKIDVANFLDGTIPQGNVANASLGAVTSLPAAIDVGSMILLSSQTGSSVASVEVGNTIITSTYSRYKIYVSGKMATDNVILRARNLNNGTENTSNCAHSYHNLGQSGSSSTTDRYQFSHYESIGNNTNESFELVLDYLDPTSNTLATTCSYQFRYANTADANRGEVGVARRNDGTETHNGIKFYPSSGSFAEVQMQVYGVTK